MVISAYIDDAKFNVPTDDLPVRSLYMRLFRSWHDGDDYYHAALVDQNIHRLLALGHAEAAGEGYRITDAGKRAWAKANASALTRVSVRAERMQAISYVASLKEYLDEKEDTVSKLIEDLRRFLDHIDSDTATTVKGIDKTVLMTAIRQGYAERVDKNLYRITDKGRMYLHNPIQIVRAAETEPARDAGFNQDALIHRLLAGQTIMRAELTTKEEQEFFRRLQRDVHVTVSGDGYVISRAGREAYENFGQDADVEVKAAPEVTAYSDPAPADNSLLDAPAVAKPGKRPYKRHAPPLEPKTTSATVIHTSGRDLTPAEIAALREHVQAASSIAPATVSHTNGQDQSSGQIAAIQELMQTVPITAPATSRPEPAAEHRCDGKDCLPCRVLAAVMDKVPEVKDLFEAMHAQDIILNNLGKR